MSIAMLRWIAGTLVLGCLACSDSKTTPGDGGGTGSEAGSGASDASSTGADAASNGKDGSVGTDAGGLVSCDFRELLCKRVEPSCPEGQVPEIVTHCYGDCVPIERCACEVVEGCPHSESYTCFKSAGHCGPYVR